MFREGGTASVGQHRRGGEGEVICTPMRWLQKMLEGTAVFKADNCINKQQKNARGLWGGVEG